MRDIIVIKIIADMVVKLAELKLKKCGHLDVENFTNGLIRSLSLAFEGKPALWNVLKKEGPWRECRENEDKKEGERHGKGRKVSYNMPYVKDVMIDIEAIINNSLMEITTDTAKVTVIIEEGE